MQVVDPLPPLIKTSTGEACEIDFFTPRAYVEGKELKPAAERNKKYILFNKILKF